MLVEHCNEAYDTLKNRRIPDQSSAKWNVAQLGGQSVDHGVEAPVDLEDVG